KTRPTLQDPSPPRGALMDLSTLRYAKSHEWAKRDGDVVTVGITQYAAEQLGDVTHLQLPKVGAATTAGKPFGEIESVKAVFDLYAPVTGEVAEVHDALAADPGPINAACYRAGGRLNITAAGGPA